MTTIKDFLLPKFSSNNWCRAARPLVKDTADMYAGTRRPDFWMQVLAYTNLVKAKAVIAQLINDYAAELDAGTLKTNMLALTDAMTEQQYTDYIEWAAPLRRGTDNPELHAAFYAAAKFLKGAPNEYIKAPISYLLKYERVKSDISFLAAVAILYPKLRALVTLEEWRGSYE